jgi:hypothetical protein
MSFERLSFNDLSGLDAAGAYANALACTLDDSFYRLQINIPPPAGRIVSMRDVVAELRAFTAEITFLRHKTAPILRS